MIITGNLTRDPELRATERRTGRVQARVAVNSRRKNSEGKWEDKPNYFDVTVWGQQGENCAQYLKKGRPRGDRRPAASGATWETEGQKRQAVDIIAESVQFLGGRDDAANGNGYSSGVKPAESDVPIDSGDFETVPAASRGGRRRHPVLRPGANTETNSQVIQVGEAT